MIIVHHIDGRASHTSGRLMEVATVGINTRVLVEPPEGLWPGLIRMLFEFEDVERIEVEQ